MESLILDPTFGVTTSIGQRGCITKAKALICRSKYFRLVNKMLIAGK